ncbi:MAG: hypothetical protein KIS66_09540 [Fimbriimonadaceae bacterium]|nr:hypothetical protein [Fimbriimonadaceae bacterium]
MSTGRRFYDLMRGHLNQEWDRLRGLDTLDAYDELNAAVNPGTAVEPSVTVTQRTVTDPAEKRKIALGILGIEEGASYQDTRQAFERLSRRSNPANFPENSPERNQATEIHRKVHWAYGVLTEEVDPTEKRFRNLELE